MPLKTNPGYYLYAYLRRMTCPFKKIDSVVPAEGRILDLGCGFGVLLLLLCSSSPKRALTGIDCREDRVRIAGEEARKTDIKNCFFRTGDIVNCDYSGMHACILLVDVLYQLTFEDKVKVIGKCRDSLAAGGVLIVKEMNTHPFWKFIWCRFQEEFLAQPLLLNRKMVNLLGESELEEILRSFDFEVETVRVDRGYAYPHILFICRNQTR